MMKDYKDTLNLPSTAFPMKANLAQREPDRLAKWTAKDLYGQLRERGKNRPKFILADGPPYANGPIHLGTSLNKFLKDMVMKSKTLSGFDTPYVPGWDCHGMPIELKVEKKIGKAGVKVPKKDFRQACRDFAVSQVKLQKDDFIRLGIFADWERPYLTMSADYEANMVRTLAKIVANGHLSRGQKPVHWCTDCASALAEAEVEYQDKTSPAIDVSFSVIDPKRCFELFGLPAMDVECLLPIWTTTPWTLPANQAVCLNPKFTYVLFQDKSASIARCFVMAKTLVESSIERYGISEMEVLAEMPGEALEGLMLQHPILDRQVPVIMGDHVTTESGTGCVHTAPAHGQDDYVVSLRYQLPMDNPVDSRSCFVKGTPLVAGLHVKKANAPIIQALNDAGHLLHHAEILHAYPHCWRHKTPLIFRATAQWFIALDQQHLREKSLSAIDEVTWIPAWGQKRIRNMVETRPDWCISRQRNWGTPIPLFIHKETGECHPKTQALLEAVAAKMDAQGIEAWFESDVKIWLGEDADQYDQVFDILDVWFDAGVSHACVLDQREGLQVPADLYLEGSDQHRGWFQSSLLTSVAYRDAPPYKAVLTHGYVVDGQGFKMSKSLGNVVSPAKVVKQYGADILRLWVASSDYTNDISFSDEILKRIADAYRRLRNTARFLLSNLDDYDVGVARSNRVDAGQFSMDDLTDLDRWAIHYAQSVQAKIIDAYDRYHFQQVYQLVHHFCSQEMGSFYLDVLKDRLYTAKRDGKARRSAQTALYFILEAMVRWFAPILSFTADEIWEHMPGERESFVFLDQWFTNFPSIAPSKLDWALIMDVRNAVNKVLETARRDGDIRSALDASVVLYADSPWYDSLVALDEELRFVLITSQAAVSPLADAPAQAIDTDIDGLRVVVDVLTDEKCSRCWQRRKDVGESSEHPSLCGRCIVNVDGEGESRRYA